LACLYHAVEITNGIKGCESVKGRLFLKVVDFSEPSGIRKSQVELFDNFGPFVAGLFLKVTHPNGLGEDRLFGTAIAVERNDGMPSSACAAFV